MNSPAQEQTKKCSRCKLKKDISSFNKNSYKKDGLSSECRECCRKYLSEWYAKPENKKRSCDSSSEWYAKPENKKKHAEWSATRYKNNRKKTWRQYLWRKYKITPEEWKSIFLSQGSCCAICKNNKSNGVGWVVDHNHETGQNRSILCHSCNTMIGFSKENIQTHLYAIEYLKKWNMGGNP